MSKYFVIPFARDGDKTAIPDTVQPGGEISYPEGWTADYEAEQGVDPNAKDVDRQKENQFKFDISEAMKEVQERGILPYRADVDYPVDAVVTASDSSQYIAIAANGPATSVIDPVGNPGTWNPELSHNHSAAQITSGVLAVVRGGTGVATSTGSGSTVRSASPALTGNPTAPTQSPGNNSTRLASTAFVKTNVDGLLGLSGNYDVILAVGVYTSGTFTIPNGRTWDDYDIVIMDGAASAGLDTYGSTGMIFKEEMADSLNAWLIRSKTESSDSAAILAISSTQFTVDRNGSDTVRFVAGYRKEGVA